MVLKHKRCIEAAVDFCDFVSRSIESSRRVRRRRGRRPLNVESSLLIHHDSFR